MSLNGQTLGAPASSARIWRFGDYEYDEMARQLRVRGRAVELESKPLDILLQLLLHAGEVVTKEELLESVWPDVMVVDGSLATAVSKLRKAMGDEQHPAIVTVPRIGYRLAIPVSCKVMAARSNAELDFKPGDTVPGREQWRLLRALDRSQSSEVWLARNPKTSEQRVFKFAADGARLKALKREITVYRFLKESLGDRPEFVRLLEWNLETAPFFLESEYAGSNLAEWANEQGGLASIPLAMRIGLLVDICQTVADAHAIGILHKDLKPANVLVVPRQPEGFQIKIADFGSSSLFDPLRLQELGITNLGFTETSSTQNPAITGTLMYMAPEVLAGQSPTASADVFALGVMLYQLVVGDFRRPLAPGWESEIADPLLQEDVAAAACGDPEKRIASARELAERLRTLDERRARRDELETAKMRALVAERKLAESRSRRPWVVGTVGALAAGLIFSVVQYKKAVLARDTASRQTAIAGAINAFLSDDLLGRGNPFASGQSTESLMEAIRQASPNIDREFKREPIVAARLHQTIAHAFDTRTDYPDARAEYARAAELFKQAEGESSEDAITVQLQRATLEARSYEAGSLPLAESILQSQDELIAKIPGPRPELRVWESSARGMIALIDNDPKKAAENFQAAVDESASLPQFDERARLTMMQRLAFCFIRMGDGARAETLFRALIAAFTKITGPDSPNVLRVRLNLAQAYMIEKKHADAIREANAIFPIFVSRLGTDHELTMQLLTTRAQSEGSLGLWDEAIRDDLAIHATAVKKQGAGSFFAVATLADAALAQCRAGRIHEGEANARTAYQVSSKAFGPRAGLTGGTAYTLASCLTMRNTLGEAASLLKNIDVPAVAQLAGDPDYGAEIELVQAEIAFKQGDIQSAKALLDKVSPVFTRDDTEPYLKRSFQSLKSAISKSQPAA